MEPRHTAWLAALCAAAALSGCSLPAKTDRAPAQNPEEAVRSVMAAWSGGDARGLLKNLSLSDELRGKGEELAQSFEEQPLAQTAWRWVMRNAQVEVGAVRPDGEAAASVEAVVRLPDLAPLARSLLQKHSAEVAGLAVSGRLGDPKAQVKLLASVAGEVVTSEPTLTRTALTFECIREEEGWKVVLTPALLQAFCCNLPAALTGF